MGGFLCVRSRYVIVRGGFCGCLCGREEFGPKGVAGHLVRLVFSALEQNIFRESGDGRFGWSGWAHFGRNTLTGQVDAHGAIALQPGGDVGGCVPRLTWSDVRFTNIGDFDPNMA